MLSLPNYWQTILRWREIIICPKCFVYSIHIYCTYSKPNTKWILLSTLGRLISIFLQFRLALKLKLGLSLEKWLLQCKCIQNQYILNVCAWRLSRISISKFKQPNFHSFPCQEMEKHGHVLEKSIQNQKLTWYLFAINITFT